jgi:hypothetical protein
MSIQFYQIKQSSMIKVTMLADAEFACHYSSFPIQKKEREINVFHNEWQFTYNVVLICIDLRWW